MDSEIEVLFQDKDIMVVNKPSGILSEGGDAQDRDLEAVVSESLGKQVWCCHRLDKLTSGAILLRKNKRFTRELAHMFENRQFRKSYWAITRGIWPKQQNLIENRLTTSTRGRTTVCAENGKPARTSFRVLAHDQKNQRSWLELLLKTGRTHQARVHCADSGHPIMGDSLYGDGELPNFFGLHARELRFRHPEDGKDISAIAPAPESWSEYLPDSEQK
ncbi:MAG: RluA family pseudouridine synthase [Opitutaceae bacterium]